MSKWSFRLSTVALSLFLGAPVLAQKGYDDRRAEMDAQIDLLRKEKELNDALRAVAGSGAAAMPSVVSIMGIEGRFTARLMQPSGVVGNYSEGDTVRPGLVVASITPRAVAVKVGEGKRARTVPLEFMAGAATTGPAGPGMPGLPPGAPGGGGVLPPELLPAPPSVLPAPRAPGQSTPAATPAPAPASTPPGLAPVAGAPITAGQAAAAPAAR
ncbi:hypothetical protein FN976_10970 [Caenimonas sedimenti]|uniref:Type IV pilus biogenesis protein PilP n=1 Tax=Caenimonas sedimenti TaxID=2596921 RepID=A0A562ZS65_9BURK|nr:hypothetical protein [Caenimonas sedimenti]TWO71432.1 hypothetical protein FN976_10970 [Caenimonas sedimenti]